MTVYENREHLILASASPRRQQYLADLGLRFSVVAAQIDETARVGEEADAFVKRMAKSKAQAVGLKHANSWVIGGDTVVTVDKEILGKPLDYEDAFKMLMKLSGRTHHVLSAIVLYRNTSERMVTQVVSSQVEFFPFPESVARAYIATGEPMDKAGSYGIQGKGAVLVRKISGSYTNIVGMPLGELVHLLLREQVISVQSV